MADNVSNPNDLILRDRLALDRTRLANERTLLAYLRTALMLVVAGATAVKFVAETPGVVFTGWLFVVIGLFVAALGTWRFMAMRRAINQRTGKAEDIERQLDELSLDVPPLPPDFSRKDIYLDHD